MVDFATKDRPLSEPELQVGRDEDARKFLGELKLHRTLCCILVLKWKKKARPVQVVSLGS